MALTTRERVTLLLRLREPLRLFQAFLNWLNKKQEISNICLID